MSIEKSTGLISRAFIFCSIKLWSLVRLFILPSFSNPYRTYYHFQQNFTSHCFVLYLLYQIQINPKLNACTDLRLHLLIPIRLSCYKLLTAQTPNAIVAIKPPNEKSKIGASPPSNVVPTLSPTFLAYLLLGPEHCGHRKPALK